MSIDPRRERESIEVLLGPIGEEVSCEQCFELLDAYVDSELRGSDPDERFPGMGAHLSGCPACSEDHEALLHLVQASE